MKLTIRELPPICLLVALGRLLRGRLRIDHKSVEIQIPTTNDVFRSFRRIEDTHGINHEESCAFSVQFRFSMLTDRQNRIASILPMLMIAGFPGFCCKVYLSEESSGRWMGLYTWASRIHLEAYKRSLVYRVMKKRAAEGTVIETIYDESDVDQVIQKLLK